MAEVKQRNGMTDLLKFIFAVMIVCYHSKSFADRGGSFIFTQGYIAVDFFFITAGFHLAASAMRKRDAGGGYSLGRETAGYMGRRLSRILPLYLTAAVIALTAAAAIKGLSVKGVVKLAADSIGEWTFLQQTGFDTGILVGASWFLSALILLSLLLYPMVRKFGDTFLYVIAPLVFAFMFGLAFHHVPDIQAPRTMLGGMIMIGLARGLFEMCLGCLIFGLVRLFRGYDLKKAGKIILTVTEVLIYAGVIVYHSIGKHPKKYDWYTIIALGIAVLITCSGFSLSGKVIKGKVFTFFGGVELCYVHQSQVVVAADG